MSIDDVAFKILHTADWHLGARFPSFEAADQAKLTRARLEVVRRIFDLAQQAQVDAVLVAGDIFDSPHPDEIWWSGLLSAIREHSWTDRRLFLLPGNHDPLMSGTVWAPTSTFRQRLPAGCRVIEVDNEEIPLSEEVVLLSSPCRSKAGSTDLALGLPERADGDERIRIGMVHGRAFAMEGVQTNFPIDPDAARLRGLDYLALGDEHRWVAVGPEDPPALYPGAPESCNFGEPECGWVAVVFFRRRNRRALVQKERVGRWAWRQVTIQSLEALRELRREDLAQTVLRLTFDLELTLSEVEKVQRILAELKGTEAVTGRAGVLVAQTDGLRLDTRAEEKVFEDLPEVLQATVRRLREKQSEQPEIAQRALLHLYKLVRKGG